MTKTPWNERLKMYAAVGVIVVVSSYIAGLVGGFDRTISSDGCRLVSETEGFRILDCRGRR